MIEKRVSGVVGGGLAAAEEDGWLYVKLELLEMCVCWGKVCNSHTNAVCMQSRAGWTGGLYEQG